MASNYQTQAAKSNNNQTNHSHLIYFWFWLKLISFDLTARSAHSRWIGMLTAITQRKNWIFWQENREIQALGNKPGPLSRGKETFQNDVQREKTKKQPDSPTTNSTTQTTIKIKSKLRNDLYFDSIPVWTIMPMLNFQNSIQNVLNRNFIEFFYGKSTTETRKSVKNKLKEKTLIHLPNTFCGPNEKLKAKSSLPSFQKEPTEPAVNRNTKLA